MANHLRAAGDLAVEIRSRKFDPETDRAKAAATELGESLRRELGDELPEVEPNRGSKGDPITVGAFVLALISSGAVTKALGAVKSWIDRDPDDRELRVQGTVAGKEIDLRLTAKNIGDVQVAEILRAVAVATPNE